MSGATPPTVGRPSQTSWSSHYAARREIRKRWPDPFRLPLQKRFSDVVQQCLKPGCRLLDVGAADDVLRRRLEDKAASYVHETLDIDPAKNPTYRSWNQITTPFDVVALGEVIEHLTLEDGARLLRDVRGALKPGGRLVLSTPNMVHPNRYWEDVDHRTPYRYDEIAALLVECGFDVVEIWRIFNDSWLSYALHRYAFHWLHRFLSVDYAASICVTASRPERD